MKHNNKTKKMGFSRQDFGCHGYVMQMQDHILNLAKKTKIYQNLTTGTMKNDVKLNSEELIFFLEL